MTPQAQKSLEQEFGLPFAAIEEIGEARRTDDLHANSFGGRTYMQSPVCKGAVYKKHGLDFERGEAVAWAYIWEGMQS